MSPNLALSRCSVSASSAPVRCAAKSSACKPVPRPRFKPIADLEWAAADHSKAVGTLQCMAQRRLLGHEPFQRIRKSGDRTAFVRIHALQNGLLACALLHLFLGPMGRGQKVDMRHGEFLQLWQKRTHLIV